MSRLNQYHVIIDGKMYYDAANQPLHFVKLNVDCWERIFDLLSLRDILAMNQTCQRMCTIGGYYFRENFRGISCEHIGEKYTIDSINLIRLNLNEMIFYNQLINWLLLGN